MGDAGIGRSQVFKRMDGNRSLTFVHLEIIGACADDLRISAIAPNPAGFPESSQFQAASLSSARRPLAARQRALRTSGTARVSLAANPPALRLIRSLFGAGRCGGTV